MNQKNRCQETVLVTSTQVDARTKREQRVRAAVSAPRQTLPSQQRRFKGGTTGFMVAVHVLATIALLPRFWSWQGLIAFVVLYWMTVLGVTLGLHRLVAHRSFEVPGWLERVLVVMGTLAAQSGPIDWVALHRHHHRFSDQPNDHHDAGRGLWWSHSEWMLHDIPALKEKHRYAGDLLKDRFYVWLDRWFLLLQIPLGLGLYWYGEAAGVHGGGRWPGSLGHPSPFSSRVSRDLAGQFGHPCFWLPELQ